MSGLGFDPKRFRRLMAAEELLKRMKEIQRGEASPQEESVLPLPTEQKTESRSEPEKETGPKEERAQPEAAVPQEAERRQESGLENKEKTVRKPLQEITEDWEIRKEGIPAAPERSASEDMPKADRNERGRGGFFSTKERGTETGNTFRDWDRRWERENRRFDSGFSLF